MAKQLTDPTAVEYFCLGGNATFTLVGKKSGKRFTFKMKSPSESADITFVSLLTGSDNWKNYSYFGYVKKGKFLHGGKKAKVIVENQAVQAFAWFWKNLETSLAKLEFWHEGKCAACQKKLTVPESIACGFGKTCADRWGVPWVKPPVDEQAELPGMAESTG